MDPLAGVGDAVLVLLPMTIFGVMAGNMALEGSALGILLGVAYWDCKYVFAAIGSCLWDISKEISLLLHYLNN